MEEYLKDGKNVAWLWWQDVHTKFHEDLLKSSNVITGAQAKTKTSPAVTDLKVAVLIAKNKHRQEVCERVFGIESQLCFGDQTNAVKICGVCRTHW
jgi:hypothetical protein